MKQLFWLVIDLIPDIIVAIVVGLIVLAWLLR